MENISFEVLSDLACHLGEGPAFETETNTAWWFDILENRLFEAALATGRVSVHELPEMASGIASVDARRQLVLGSSGLHLRDRASGQLELLQPIEAEDPATRSNDMRVHPCGAVWAGTMGREAEEGAGAVYWFFHGELRRLYGGVSIPNAIAFSADGRVGYFIDTPTAILKRVALDPSNGLPVGEPETFFDHHGGEGFLDGAIVDRDGLLWCARFGAGCIDAYSPDGTRLRTVRVPARQPTRPAFVGPGLTRMLVTSAWENMDEAARRADPLAGQTFLLDVGAGGRPEPLARPFA